MNKIITLALTVFLGLGGLSACGEHITSDDPSERPAVAQTSTEPTEAESPDYATPAADDFSLRVKTLSKECFDTAGCNITFRIDPTYIGVTSPDPDATYEVTYKVTGAQDPMINTFTMTGSQASVEDEEMAETASASDKLHAHVTEVEEQ